MICGNCNGDGHILIKKVADDGSIKFIPEDCPECLGVGEIQIDNTPKYPDSHGDDNY